MENKLCPKCNILKNVTAYNKRAKSADGFADWCRECTNLWRRNRRLEIKATGEIPRSDQWNKENRDHLNKLRTAKRRETRDYLRSLKLNQPCTDCGGIFPPTCMDWDHLDPTQKEFNICNEAIREMYSKERLHAEIDKCELVCANCHRIRSSVQRGEDPWQSF